MVTNEQTNEQPGDPSASLPLTSVRRQSFAKDKDEENVEKEEDEDID